MKELNKFLTTMILVLFIVFASLGAGVLLRGTSAVDFTLDYDNSGAGVSQTITFNRGSTGTVDAVLTWNETADQFEYNQPLSSRLKIHLEGEVGANGAAAGKTVSYMDDSPSNEYSDDTGSGFVVTSDDATLFKMGSNSLKAAFSANAALEDGLEYTAGQPYDFSSDESFGFWIYSTVALDAADFALELQDDGGEQIISLGAVAVTTWTWQSLTLPAADADKDVISEMRIVQKVDKGALNLYIDAVFKWDDLEQVNLTYDIKDDGDFSVLADATAGSAWSNQVRYIDYFVDYDSTDHIVFITDESANKLIIGYAYE